MGSQNSSLNSSKSQRQQSNQHRGYSIQNKYSQINKTGNQQSRLKQNNNKLSQKLQELDQNQNNKKNQTILDKILGSQYKVQKYFNQSFLKNNDAVHPRFVKLKYSQRQSELMLLKYVTQPKQFQSWQQALQLYRYRKDNNLKKDQRKYKDCIRQNFEQTDNGFLFLPITYNVLSNSNNIMCNQAAQGKLLHILFPKYPSHLFQQIYKRKQLLQLYDQQQIWFALYSITTAALQIHQFGDKFWLGSIHPYNIFINNEGKLAVMPWFALPGNKNCYIKWYTTGCSQQFISPECMGFMGKAYDQQSYKRVYFDDGFPRCLNKHQIDSFAAGMTILSMATIEPDMSGCYQGAQSQTVMLQIRQSSRVQKSSNKNSSKINSSIINKKHDISKSLYESKLLRKSYMNQRNYMSSQKFATSINKKEIARMLRQVQKNYSKLLYFVIQRLLDPNPETRLDFFSLYEQLLQPYQHQILSFNSQWMHQSNLSPPQTLNQSQAIDTMRQKDQSQHKINLFDSRKESIDINPNINDKLYTLNNNEDNGYIASFGDKRCDTIKNLTKIHDNTNLSDDFNNTSYLAQLKTSPQKSYQIYCNKSQDSSKNKKEFENNQNRYSNSSQNKVQNPQKNYIIGNHNYQQSIFGKKIQKFDNGIISQNQRQMSPQRQNRGSPKIIKFQYQNKSVYPQNQNMKVSEEINQLSSNNQCSYQAKSNINKMTVLQPNYNNNNKYSNNSNKVYSKIIYHSNYGTAPDSKNSVKESSPLITQIQSNVRYLN